MSQREESQQKLQQILPYLFAGMKKAQEKSSDVQFGILAIDEGGKGGGQIVVQFRMKEFLDDLAKAIDAPAISEEDLTEAREHMEMMKLFGNIETTVVR